jgi:hypothetical protein
MWTCHETTSANSVLFDRIGFCTYIVLLCFVELLLRELIVIADDIGLNYPDRSLGLLASSEHLSYDLLRLCL